MGAVRLCIATACCAALVAGCTPDDPAGAPGSVVTSSGQGGATNGAGGNSGNAGNGASTAGMGGGGSMDCPPNQGDCNGDPADGCEKDLATDAANCGACAHDCLGGECSESSCQPTLVAYSNQANPRGIAVDATHVYWTSDYSVERAPKAGGMASTLTLASPGNALVVDGGYAYYPDDVGTRRVAITGGMPTTVSASNGEFGLAVAGGFLFMARFLGVDKVPLAGGTTTPVEPATYPNAITTDGVHVFWTEFGNNTPIKRAPVAGGASDTVPNHQLGIGGGIFSLGSDLYTREFEIWRVDKTSGAGTFVTGQNLVGSPLTTAQEIVADGERVWWIEDGDVHSVAADGTDERDHTFNVHANCITQDADAVYYTQWVFAGIYRIAK